MDDLFATIDGTSYRIEHKFSDRRAIVNFGGAYVLADRVDLYKWELSGEPAREDEKPILNALVAGIKTTTTVTKDE